MRSFGIPIPQAAGHLAPPAWLVEHLPRVLPVAWECLEHGVLNLYQRRDPQARRVVQQIPAQLGGGTQVRLDELRVIVSGATESDGRRWLHVSISRPARLPTWEELREVKDLFIGRDVAAYQVLPPAAQHVNINETCLHLWRAVDGDVLPDFTRGTGSL